MLHSHFHFESYLAAPNTAIDLHNCRDLLNTVIAAHGILRLKGDVSGEGAQAPLVVQAVGPRVESYFDSSISSSRMGLVVIGEKGLDETAIRRALEG